MASPWVIVARFESPFQAEFARSVLESAGIRCMVGNSFLANWFWHFSNAIGGVTLAVPPESTDDDDAPCNARPTFPTLTFARCEHSVDGCSPGKALLSQASKERPRPR